MPYSAFSDWLLLARLGTAAKSRLRLQTHACANVWLPCWLNWVFKYLEFVSVLGWAFDWNKFFVLQNLVSSELDRMPLGDFTKSINVNHTEYLSFWILFPIIMVLWTYCCFKSLAFRKQFKSIAIAIAFTIIITILAWLVNSQCLGPGHLDGLERDTCDWW